jgi:hypothetical protein
MPEFVEMGVGIIHYGKEHSSIPAKDPAIINWENQEIKKAKLQLIYTTSRQE